MERSLKREVLATLLRAGRHDLANVVAKVMSVDQFLEAMLPKIAKLDIRLKKNELKRGAVNYFRLQHWTDAFERAKNRVKHHGNSVEPAALEALKQALQKEFESDFPPLKSTLKQIDKQLQ